MKYITEDMTDDEIIPDWRNLIMLIMPDRAIITTNEQGEPISIMPLVLTLQ